MRTIFGMIPTGLSFKLPGSSAVWFVSSNRRAFRFAADQETKIYVDFDFNEEVIPLNYR